MSEEDVVLLIISGYNIIGDDEMKKRDLYLKKLIGFRDKDFIKVITGIRRSGKSTLLDLFEAYLLEAGVKPNSIIRMNFESLEFEETKDYKSLYNSVKEKMNPVGKTYILLDEIQQINAWEKAVNSLRLIPKTDIYITGSNAYLLASEISTLLSGRYVEIKVLPLSFSEYLDFHDIDRERDVLEAFNNYLRDGGFPGITQLSEQPETITAVLEGIYNTVIMKDVIQRNTVRDAALLENVVRFMAANIGNRMSTKKVSDYLTSAGRKTTSETIDGYLRMLESAYILYRARRYDLKGKLHLKTQEKFYFIDTGLRNTLLGNRGSDYGHIIENVVYFELLRRGFEVSVGKLGTLEVDFVATKPDKKMYVQVSASILDDATRERELKPLREIPDNYEKIILTMDRIFLNDIEGIKIVYLLDFLLYPLSNLNAEN